MARHAEASSPVHPLVVICSLATVVLVIAFDAWWPREAHRTGEMVYARATPQTLVSTMAVSEPQVPAGANAQSRPPQTIFVASATNADAANSEVAQFNAVLAMNGVSPCVLLLVDASPQESADELRWAAQHMNAELAAKGVPPIAILALPDLISTP
jgi:hypothetical protein